MTETLDEWIERMSFSDLREQWLCHAKQFTDDPEGLVRLMFISLRQDLQEGAEKNGTLLLFTTKPKKKVTDGQINAVVERMGKLGI